MLLSIELASLPARGGSGDHRQSGFSTHFLWGRLGIRRESKWSPIIEAKKRLSWNRLDVGQGVTSPNARKPGGVSGVVGGNGGTGSENEREAASSVSR